MAKNNNKKNNKIKAFEEVITFIHKIKQKYILYDIIAVTFIFLGVFTILADINKGGYLGYLYKELLFKLFGISHFLLIFIFLVLGVGWLLKFNISWKISSTISWIVLFFILTGFSEIFFHNGGYLGKTIVQYEIYLGKLGLILILFLVAIICISIIFEKPVGEIILLIYEKVKRRRGVEIDTYTEKTISEKSTKEIRTVKEKMKMPDVIKPQKIKQEVKEEIRLKKLPIKTTWELPPISLLDKTETQPDTGDIKENIQIIQTTLQNFGINAEVVEVTIGPTVTRYAIRPPEGVKLSKILALQSDLALALAVQNVRIEAPIPGRALIGIEVPNIKGAIVRLRSLIENPEFLESENLLLFPLGRLITGEPFYSDLSSMPHLLIAGTTGAGKSVFIHSLIISLLMKNTPETLNFILIDPKRVELIKYENIPHLLMDPIVDIKKVVPVMNWLIDEMERRYKEFQGFRVRDIDVYNKLQIQKRNKIMPRIVFIVDEMADLMVKQGNIIEAAIIRLAQMARATGIHLVLATQRPSVDVVTGLIKANIPNRICFKVASQVDSRTVLDYAGAEKLIGAGDMLFMSTLFGGLKRIQAPLITEKEIERIVDFWSKQALEKEDFEKEIIPLEEYESVKTEIKEGEESEEELVKAALQIILETGKASTSLLQRKLKIGYARAARILDILEEKGVVGPQEGTKPRKVLIEKMENFKEDELEE